MDTIASNDQDAWLNVVHDQVKSLRFGVVQIVVHESRVVQIKWTEKVRLQNIEGARSARERS